MSEALPLLDDDQKAAYLADDHRCPYCQSYDIATEGFVARGGAATLPVRCQKCDRVWEDVYTLSEIREVES